MKLLLFGLISQELTSFEKRKVKWFYGERSIVNAVPLELI